MKKEKMVKIVITVLIVVVIILFLLSLDNVSPIKQNRKVKKKDNGVTELIDKGMLKDQKIKDLDITDVSMTYVENAGTTFKLTISNKTSEAIELKSLNISFKDKAGNNIVVLTAATGGSIKANQKNIIRLTHPDDLTKAESIEYSEGN